MSKLKPTPEELARLVRLIEAKPPSIPFDRLVPRPGLQPSFEGCRYERPNPSLLRRAINWFKALKDTAK